jgi:hypothetical protein
MHVVPVLAIFFGCYGFALTAWVIKYHRQLARERAAMLALEYERRVRGFGFARRKTEDNGNENNNGR